MAHQVGDVINIIQTTSHQLFDPDELLTVSYIPNPKIKKKLVHMFKIHLLSFV